MGMARRIAVAVVAAYSGEMDLQNQKLMISRHTPANARLMRCESRRLTLV